MSEKRINLDMEAYAHRHEKEHIHDREHPPTRVSVALQDSILWFSDKTDDFEIVDIHKDNLAPPELQKKGAPPNPFFRPFPVKPHGKGRCVSSGPANPEAIGQQYKAVYRVNGKLIDPHIIID